MRWLDGITDSADTHLSELQETMKVRAAWPQSMVTSLTINSYPLSWKQAAHTLVRVLVQVRCRKNKSDN